MTMSNYLELIASITEACWHEMRRPEEAIARAGGALSAHAITFAPEDLEGCVRGLWAYLAEEN